MSEEAVMSEGKREPFEPRESIIFAKALIEAWEKRPPERQTQAEAAKVVNAVARVTRPASASDPTASELDEAAQAWRYKLEQAVEYGRGQFRKLGEALEAAGLEVPQGDSTAGAIAAIHRLKAAIAEADELRKLGDEYRRRMNANEEQRAKACRTVAELQGALDRAGRTTAQRDRDVEKLGAYLAEQYSVFQGDGTEPRTPIQQAIHVIETLHKQRDVAMAERLTADELAAGGRMNPRLQGELERLAEAVCKYGERPVGNVIDGAIKVLAGLRSEGEAWKDIAEERRRELALLRDAVSNAADGERRERRRLEDEADTARAEAKRLRSTVAGQKEELQRRGDTIATLRARADQNRAEGENARLRELLESARGVSTRELENRQKQALAFGWPDLADALAAQVEAVCAKHGRDYASMHEALGVLLEEVEEFKVEVFRKQTERHPRQLGWELLDVAVVAMRALAQLARKEPAVAGVLKMAADRLRLAPARKTPVVEWAETPKPTGKLMVPDESHTYIKAPDGEWQESPSDPRADSLKPGPGRE